VLEGATHGGQFISKHTLALLGVTPETAGRFFHGYGERTGAMWRTFGAALTGFATLRDSDSRQPNSKKLRATTKRCGEIE
jgi:heme oxygenase